MDNTNGQFVIHENLRDRNQPVLPPRTTSPGGFDAECAYPPRNLHWMHCARVAVAAEGADDFSKGFWKLITFLSPFKIGFPFRINYCLMREAMQKKISDPARAAHTHWRKLIRQRHIYTHWPNSEYVCVQSRASRRSRRRNLRIIGSYRNSRIECGATVTPSLQSQLTRKYYLY